ncbi:MAG: alpha-mannosidase [Phycisphaerae bacterium]|nr:alpha-mannosidase [Phycisphaerae bacterium]
MAKGSAPRKKRIGHVVSHTHWDREWRYPIWETRFMLVDFVDELIEVLERGQYPGFLLDGQCSPILDYLEIRPEQRERLTKLIAAGKLSIGPWYTLPDEYPVDGEALVRNLLRGRRVSDALGGVMNIGYTPFGWGQTAQLAQLYAGFGMDVALIGKRVSKDRAPQCEFIWRGPDGCELLATRFGEMGRQNFYFHVHLSALFGTDHFGPGWRYDWADGGVAFHRADDEQMEQDPHQVDAPVKWYPEYITRDLLDRVWATMDESVLADDRIMMNGCDYTASQPMFEQMMARMNEVDADTDREWVHETLPDYVQLMRESIDRSKLKVVEGELRDGPAAGVTGNALTTRLYLKRLNKKAQNMLIRFAEPLAVAAAAHGASYPSQFMRLAWENLLASHPHDSINGVTQDKTVEDVQNRLNQVIDLSQSIGNRAMQALIQRIDLSNFAADDVLIVVFNPLPYVRREVVRAWVNMPAHVREYSDWPESSRDVLMFDADGHPVDTQCQGSSRELYSVAEVHTRTHPLLADRYLVYFDTGEIPAGGYKIFRAGYRDETQAARWMGELDRTDTLLAAPNIIENEYLRVVMNPNGTFDLTDKERDRTYAGLNYYEDRGEHGDYWVNKRPMFDEVHTSQGSAARLWSEQTGPMHATLASEVTMRIPARGRKDEQRRGDALSDLVIQTRVTLRAAARQVEVEVTFDNRQADHYLRAMFPTGLAGATHSDAGGHFIVDHRPIRPAGPMPETIWPDMATLPQNHFVDVSDGKVGFALLNDSLTEFEVIDSPERVLAVSLVRGVKNWVCTEARSGSGWPSQAGGQAFGRHVIRYALRPHAGTWDDADIALAAECFNVPVRLVQTRATEGELPANKASLYAIDNPKLRFSCLKRAEDRDTFIVRLYNPTATEQRGHLRFAAKIAKAWQTNLNEERAKAIPPTDANSVPITAAPKKIVTIELELGW